MLNNSTDSYGWLAIVFHWISAITIFGLFAVGYWMVDLNYYSEWYRTAPHYHKSVGLLLLFLTLVRIFWKARSISPAPLGNKLEQKSASMAHLALYLILMSLFVTGYLISSADGRSIEVFNWFALPSVGELFTNQEDLAGLVHEWLAYGLITLAAIHALAALKHHFVNKDSTLKRMLIPSKK